MPTSRVARSQHGLAYPNQQWMAAQTMTSSQLCCSNYFQYHFLASCFDCTSFKESDHEQHFLAIPKTT